MSERLSLIQGPPGTGKTLVVAALVANWMKDIEKLPKILVCAPSNTAADYIAERLYQIPSLQDKIIRFSSERREDIFNLDLKKLKSYNLIHKIIYMDKQMQNKYAADILSLNKRQRTILSHVEYMFGDCLKPEEELTMQ